ncbi:MAG: hypothetical protein Q8Q33_03330, partial [Chlamydiota bacterium]|nr:hypothetical protein [Chlamydiota bacterium]
ELRTYISGRASFARQVQRDLSAGVPLNDILNQIGPELRAQLWDIIAALRLIRDQFSTEVARELADTLLESLLQTLTFENANALWKLDIIAPTAGAMKVPGSGEAFAYKVSQDTVDIVLDAIKARAPPEVYKDIPITEADQEDFVSFDQNAQEITVRPDLWRLIQFRQRTHHILQRHEYVENILIPQLIDEGLLQAADRLHAHAITSRVDAVLEETSNHLLMPIFVRLMRIEELRAIAADHPNDADRAFYLEVQTELSRREARAEETQGLSIFSPQSMSLADQHPNRTMMTKFLDDSGQTRTAEYVDQLLPYVSGRLVEIPVELGEGKHIFSVDRLLLQDLEITEEAFAALIIEAVKLDEDVNGFHYWTLPENVSILYVESSTNMIEVSVEPNLIGFNRGLFDTDLSREDLLNLAKLSMARGLRPMTLTDELVLIRDAYAKMHISGYYINQILLEFGRKGIVSALQISKDTDQYHRALEKVNTARDKALFKALLKKRSADQIRSLRDKLSFLFSPSSIYHALLRNTYWLRVLTEAVTLRRPDIGAFKVPGTASSQYQAIVDPTIISTIVSRLNPTEYEAIPFQADSSFNRAQFHDLAHYDASAGLIRVHPRLYYKKNAEGDSVSTDLEAQRILRRHEYVENVLIPRLVQEGFISIPSGISAHAVATVVDTQIEGSPLHALMQYTLLGMNNEELEAISPDHPNDPDQVFYNAAQRLLEDRILKQSLKLETRGQIGQRDTEVIEKAFLGRIAAVDRESSYVAESIRSLFGVEIDTRQIQEIRVKLFSDDGKNKRVYRVDVKGELQLGGLNKQYSFLFKVFRPDPDDMDELSGRKPVTQEDRARARRSSYSLKAAGIHPENGPDQTIELDSGERVDVFTEGIVDGQTVVDLRRDLQKLRNQKLISEDVFQQRIRRLYRMSLIAILQMWLILGGRYILDPTGYNLMLQGSFERGYRPIFIDLDRVTKDPVALVDVMDVLVRRYA